MKHFISALFLVIGLSWSTTASAQSVFVQIEAHSNLSEAQDAARGFASNLPDVNGFRFSTGWYVIALGPYDLNTAVSQIEALKAQRSIPADSYLVDRNAYSNQFYPVGSDSLAATPLTSPSEPVAEPEAETSTEAASETAQIATPTPTVPEATPEPEPVVVVVPEETRREALRSESRLTRQEKFDLQIAMKWFGFYNGAIDAAFGPGTRNSMAAWQESKGLEPTGVLTTTQRVTLNNDYQTILASIGLRPVTDARAGITLDMPQAMVAFDRYDPPFAHYNSINDSNVRVLLISQSGDENSLLGLYDIMQTLKIVPLEGERERKNNRFTLTGANDEIQSYTHAVLNDGEIKGFTLIWPAGEDKRFDVTLKAMRDSFAPLAGTVLPDNVGDGALEQSLDLVSGLEIRKPITSRSGFYIDNQGTVLTTASAVNACGRITLDEVYEATVVAQDAGLGLALLKPGEALAPIDFARFQPVVPRLNSEIAVAGYSFGGALGAPTMTFGTLADVKGLRGEETMTRLALNISPGDAGGPVFDTSGSVMGMLLPNIQPDGKQLPADVGFATDSLAIAEFLSNNGYAAAASEFTGNMNAVEMTRQANNLTVLVGCWSE